MKVRSQCGCYLIECKNIILKNPTIEHNPYLIIETSAFNCDYVLGMYDSRGYAMDIMNQIQSKMENESKIVIDKEGIMRVLKKEIIYNMPKRK